MTLLARRAGLFQPTRRVDAGFSFAVVGYVVAAIILWWGFSTGHFGVPGGDVLVWDRAGDALRSSGDVYAIQPTRTDTFWYAPPWAVLFASVTWIPAELLWVVIVALEVAALRYIAGSWRRVGYCCWFPLVAFELASGNFNLVTAAAILAAVRGEPRVALAMAAAKLAPILAIDPRQWRIVLVGGTLLVAVTLPWWQLWPEWVTHLAAGFGQALGPQIPVPFVVRLPLAVALVVWGRPWSRALGAVIATPAFYWGSAVMLLAPIAALTLPTSGRYLRRSQRPTRDRPALPAPSTA